MDSLDNTQGTQLNNKRLALTRALPLGRFAAAAVYALACMLFAWLPSPARAQQPKSKTPRAEKLPTGMSITPRAARGTQLQFLNPDLPGMPEYLADHPISTALSLDGDTLLVLTSGYNRIADIKAKSIPELSNEYVFVYDVRQGLPVKRQVLPVPNTYMGIAWAPDGRKFFVAGGMDDNVHIFSLKDGSWAESLPPISLAHKSGLGLDDDEEAKDSKNKAVAAGVAVSADGSRLLVANNANDSVSLIDVAQQKVIAELDLRPGKNDPAKKGAPGGEYPYAVAFKGNSKGYVACQRDREIVTLDLRAAPAITARIKTRGQPGKMIFNAAQTALFAVADNSDSVVIVDTVKDRILTEIKTTAPAAMLPRKSDFKGANPTGLALSPDERTLYVTNGGTNSVAVIHLDRELDDGRVAGLIPTAWYPNAISVSRDGKLLYVVNAKSIPGPNPGACRNNYAKSGDRPCALAQQYVWQLEKGGLATIPLPQLEELNSLTLTVAANNHFPVAAREPASNQIFAFLRSRIHHVIYIVKENRTYDQILGDLEKGNGDPRLNLFPDALTPNHHEIARRFVTLDNFYDSGEVSGNGWNWSTAARATDFVERTIPMNYAKRGPGYDVEGVNRGINVGAGRAEDRIHGKLEDPDDQLPGNADVGAPDGPDDETGAGFLWDSALRAKLSVRNYGFFIELSRYSKSPDGTPPLPLLHDPAATGVRVAVPTNPRLYDITDPYFRSFDMRFADYWRFKEWEREFDEYVKHDNLPNLELLRLPHDHFGNFDKAEDGVNTVETMMADNDYAVGLVLEKVAHSKYAKDTLIFVIEDDAQNGADHVDAHRSIALVAGPYVKQRAVISRYFTTVSLLRTIEEVLGLQPLGLNDAFDAPMAEIFSAQQSAWSYKAKVPAVLRTTQLPLPAPAADEKARTDHATPAHDAAYWASMTQDFNFSEEDKLDSERFNLVLWDGLRGEDQPYPSERSGLDLRQGRAALLRDFKKSKYR
jgi:YVTN family beta-propeller protein